MDYNEDCDQCLSIHENLVGLIKDLTDWAERSTWMSGQGSEIRDNLEATLDYIVSKDFDKAFDDCDSLISQMRSLEGLINNLIEDINSEIIYWRGVTQ